MLYKQISRGLSKLVDPPGTSVGQGSSSPWCLAGWGELKEGKRLVTCSPCVQEVRDRSQLDPMSVPCRGGGPEGCLQPWAPLFPGKCEGLGFSACV